MEPHTHTALLAVSEFVSWNKLSIHGASLSECRVG